MRSSTRPSAKYSCSTSPLMFAKGRIATDGLSGSGAVSLRSPCEQRWLRRVLTAYALTGSSMFLTCCSPRSE